MDKIKFLIFVMLLSMGCASAPSYDAKQFDLVFELSPFIRVDFNQRKVIVDHGSQIRFDRVITLSKTDEQAIISSFKTNAIGVIDGEKFLRNPKEVIMPPSDLTINVIFQNTVRSKIAVAHNLKKGMVPNFGQDYRIIAFRDVVWQILSRNEALKMALAEDVQQMDNILHGHTGEK
jgi:hypothetical protein